MPLSKEEIITEEVVRYLSSIDACSEAIRWVEESHRYVTDLWETCQKPEWMTWLLVRSGCVSTKRLAQALLEMYESGNFPTCKTAKEIIDAYLSGEPLSGWRDDAAFDFHLIVFFWIERGAGEKALCDELRSRFDCPRPPALIEAIAKRLHEETHTP